MHASDRPQTPLKCRLEGMQDRAKFPEVYLLR